MVSVATLGNWSRSCSAAGLRLRLRFLPGGQAPALDGAWQKGSRTLALLLLRSQQVAEVQRRVVEKTSPGLNKL